MRQSRRGLEIFSLSFLDCICCGFGALILLFVLSKFGAPVVMEEIREDLEGKILQLGQTLHELRGETAVLNRELTGKEEQLSEEKLKLARLQGELSRIDGEFAASRQNSEVQNIIEGKLARALQDLTEEMQRLQKERPRPVSSSVVGIPVDSEYIVFIIDTSGSMQSGAWGYMQEKMQEILNVYPRVKGIQVMNDDGIFMFPQYEGQWIPDSPARRKAILKVLSTWRPFSNSSPVEGVEEAISKFRDPNKKISLYVLGDEFAGEKMQQVVEKVDRMNRGGPQGSQPVRIHAVGFPTVLNDPRGITGTRFATLMRVLCQKNGGAFVGLNTTRP